MWDGSGRALSCVGHALNGVEGEKGGGERERGMPTRRLQRGYSAATEFCIGNHWHFPRRTSCQLVFVVLGDVILVFLFSPLNYRSLFALGVAVPLSASPLPALPACLPSIPSSLRTFGPPRHQSLNLFHRLHLFPYSLLFICVGFEGKGDIQSRRELQNT